MVVQSTTPGLSIQKSTTLTAFLLEKIWKQYILFASKCNRPSRISSKNKFIDELFWYKLIVVCNHSGILIAIHPVKFAFIRPLYVFLCWLISPTGTHANNNAKNLFYWKVLLFYSILKKTSSDKINHKLFCSENSLSERAQNVRVLVHCREWQTSLGNGPLAVDISPSIELRPTKTLQKLMLRKQDKNILNSSFVNPHMQIHVVMYDTVRIQEDQQLGNSRPNTNKSNLKIILHFAKRHKEFQASRRNWQTTNLNKVRKTIWTETSEFHSNQTPLTRVNFHPSDVHGRSTCQAEQKDIKIIFDESNK